MLSSDISFINLVHIWTDMVFENTSERMYCPSINSKGELFVPLQQQELSCENTDINGFFHSNFWQVMR
jgi:hypothetical protein